MCWNYSRALVAEYLDTCCVDTESCARLNLIRTADQFFYGDRTTEIFRRSLYGMTCEHLTDDDGEALLTWYQEASPAKTFHQPETVPESQAINPPSGSTCCEWFGRFDRSTCLWKTPPNLFGTDSTLSSKAWTKAGTMRNGVCWERPTLAHRTTENAAGFWHTPTVFQRSRSEEAWEKRKKARHATGRKTIPPGSLEEQVLMSGDAPCWDWNASPVNPRNETTKLMIPTPRAQDALNRTNPCQYRRAGVPLAAWVCMFPTPRTGGMCGGSGNYQKLKELMGKGLITPKERRGMAAGNGGKLNPRWTEWLMGFPIGWSRLKPLEMPKSRSVPQPHGTFCTNEFMENNNNLVQEEETKS